MRRLAPMFVMTSIVALAGTNALAMGDHHKAKNSNTASNTSSMPATASTSSSASTPSTASSTSTPSTASSTQADSSVAYNTASGTGSTLGYTAGDRDSKSSTTAMNDAESKPTTSMDDTKTHSKAKKSKKHLARNDKASSTGNVDTSNGQAAGSVTGKSGGAGGDSSSGSSGSAGAAGSSGSSSSSSK